MCITHIDDTLAPLTPGELSVLRQKIVDAIADQAPHMLPKHDAHKFQPLGLTGNDAYICAYCSYSRSEWLHLPNWDKELAYELSVLNWEIRRAMAGSVHPYDEIWTGVN